MLKTTRRNRIVLENIFLELFSSQFLLSTLSIGISRQDNWSAVREEAELELRCGNCLVKVIPDLENTRIDGK